VDADIEIRAELPKDIEGIRELNARAFGQDLEPRIIEALRANRAALLSLVATERNEIVGHIMYSRADDTD
jgi:putative acetyltransferase